MDKYYLILELKRPATIPDIKKAFRLMAHRYHPDKPGGNADKFKEVMTAYKALLDAGPDSERAREPYVEWQSTRYSANHFWEEKKREKTHDEFSDMFGKFYEQAGRSEELRRKIDEFAEMLRRQQQAQKDELEEMLRRMTGNW